MHGETARSFSFANFLSFFSSFIFLIYEFVERLV